VHVRLWILAFLAKDEPADEAVKVVLEFVGIVGAVDDPTVVGGVCIGLGTELEAKVLDDIYFGPWLEILFFSPTHVSRDRQGVSVSLQAGGRAKEWATLLRLTMTVLIPLPLPSILDWIRSIL